MIQDGIYTLVYSNGEYRTLRIENITEEGHTFKGKTILSRKSGKSSAALGKYAVNFWTKRFTANQIEDDRFWGDEAGRQEMIDEQAAELAALKAEEQMNERRFMAVYGNEPSESF
jgi:hypothetical protein